MTTKLREALRESEERFRLLAENSTDVIARTSPDGIIRYISPACRTLYGYEPEQMVGRPGIDFLHPEDVRAMRADQAERGQHATDVVTNEYRVRRRDGTYIWAEGKTQTLRDPSSGAVIEFHTSVRDITERRGAEAEVRRARDEAEWANQAKSDFLSRMSHELRTPLNAILGFGELLAAERLSPAQLEHVAQITRSGRHLLDLINEVLDLARIERGELRLSLEPVHVGQLVREALDMIDPLATARSVAVLTPAPAGLDIHVLADRQRLKQVLLNLLSNAVKYNRDRGEVRVSAVQEGVDALIEVADTGLGIAAEDLPRAFEAFERLGAETTEVEGTGLGLALVRRLILAMGGSIEIASTLGRGTTLSIRLPVTSAPALGDRDGAPEQTPPPPGTRVRPPARSVLLVEDNPSNIKLVESILAKRPAVTLIVATQGGLALELAREHRPSLILLDLHLPDMSGEDVLRRIRADERTAGSAVVVVSADATSSQVRRLRRLGADDYLTKPFEIERFLAVVGGLAASGDEPSPAPGDGGVGGRAQPREDPIDPGPLDKLRGLYPDESGLCEFVAMFLDDTPPRIEALIEAARAGDADGVRGVAHMLRGSCGLMGAQHVVELLSLIEAAAVAGELPGEERICALQAAYDEAEAVLAERFPSPADA